MMTFPTDEVVNVTAQTAPVLTVSVEIARTTTGTALTVKVSRPALAGENEVDAMDQAMDLAIDALHKTRVALLADEGLTLGKDGVAPRRGSPTGAALEPVFEFQKDVAQVGSDR